jgi:esterase/lipase
MNWTIITEAIIIVGILAAFAGTIWYLVTHNPNYSAEEIVKNPAKIFDLIDHAKDTLTDNLAKIKEEAQEAIDTANEVKEDVKEIVRQVQEAIAEVKEDIKEIKEPVVEVEVIEDKEIVNKD